MRTKNQPVRTTTAFLPREGVKHATLHRYVHGELATLKNEDGALVTGMAHIFRCTVTGEQRRWGFDVTFAKDNGGN